MRYLVPLVLLATVGCYSPRTIGEGTAYPEANDRWGAAALEARVWYDQYTGNAQFTVNRPAHVALFALRPGAALEMMYPNRRYGGLQDRFTSGSHWVRTAGSTNRFAGNWSTVHGAGPVYILMIASEQPLQVSRYLHTSGMNWMTAEAMMYSPYMAINSLARNIVPAHNSTDWTSAVFVVWPEGAHARGGYGPSYVNIRCPGGIVLTVPTEAWRRGYIACPNDAAPVPTDSAGQDSVRIRDGAPVPPGWIRPEKEADDIEAATIATLPDAVQRRDAEGKPINGVVRGARGIEVTPAVPPRRVVEQRRAAEAAARGGATVPSVSRPARTGSRDRASDRPAADRRPTRPAARPAPRPASRPEARPQPKRPERPSRPAPKPKPKPDNDNDSD